MRRNLLLVVAFLALQGCICDRDRYVADRWPVIALPERPVLTGVEVSPNLAAVMDYAQQLEAGIKSYNLQARDHNKANGYPETGP